MKEYAQQLIATAAHVLVGKVHTSEEMHAALFQLALDIVTPGPFDDHHSTRRMPVANEILPPHQRATWARGKTVYDLCVHCGLTSGEAAAAPAVLCIDRGVHDFGD